MGSTGVLLIGHGTRCADGTSEFLELARRFADTWDRGPTVPCFLELQQPGILSAAERLASQGVDHILAVPVLLFAAGHALRDIPASLAELRERYPKIHFAQSQPLGLHPGLLALSRRRCEETRQDAARHDASGSMLVMVGRGSLNDQATSDMIRFATERARMDAYADVATGFVAMCQPTLGDALHAAAAGRFATVVVQPHLLFRGELSRRIERMVCSWAARHPSQRWLVTRHLGPEPEVVEALIDRALKCSAPNTTASRDVACQ